MSSDAGVGCGGVVFMLSSVMCRGFVVCLHQQRHTDSEHIGQQRGSSACRPRDKVFCPWREDGSPTRRRDDATITGNRYRNSHRTDRHDAFRRTARTPSEYYQTAWVLSSPINPKDLRGFTADWPLWKQAMPSPQVAAIRAFMDIRALSRARTAARTEL